MLSSFEATTTTLFPAVTKLCIALTRQVEVLLALLMANEGVKASVAEYSELLQ